MNALERLLREFSTPVVAEQGERRDWDGWREWLGTLFPRYVGGGFAARHEAFWDWMWAIRLGERPRPFLGIWPRGGGKTTSAELGTVGLGVSGQRRYALYVRQNQEKADESVANIAGMLESRAVDVHYPEHAQRAVSKYGQSKGWRRNRLRTAGGFTCDALGLDAAGRGAKIEDQRPDLIILDDIDDKHDSPHVTLKKLETLTNSILTAGSPDCAVVAIQNLITPHGVFARLLDGRADALADRLLSGPEPALVDPVFENRFDEQAQRVRTFIKGGRPTWQGQSLARCQSLLNTIGLKAFQQECQHEVFEREGALWKRSMIQRIAEAPRLKRVAVGVDPSGGANEIGIIAAGLGYDDRAYVLEDATVAGKLGPLAWGRAAVQVYDRLEADCLAAERNYGGDMVESNIGVAAGPGRTVPVKMVSASRGKDVRAEPVASLYSEGRVSHVGDFPELEQEMTTWLKTDNWSPNRLDALVWVLTELMLGTPGPVVSGFEAGAMSGGGALGWTPRWRTE